MRRERRPCSVASGAGQRPLQPEVGGGEGVALADAQREVVRRPRPEAGHGDERAHELVQTDAAVEAHLVLGHRAGEGVDGVDAGAGEAEAVEIGDGEDAPAGGNVWVRPSAASPGTGVP